MGLSELVGTTLWLLVVAFTLGGTDIVNTVASEDHAWGNSIVPALAVLTLLTVLVNTDLWLWSGDNMSGWDSVCGCCVSGWSMASGSWNLSGLNVAASSSLAALVLLGNNLSVTSWACDLMELEALGGVALTVVLVATAFGINSLALQVLVALTCWLGNLWADNMLALFAVLLWCAAN